MRNTGLYNFMYTRAIIRFTMTVFCDGMHELQQSPLPFPEIGIWMKTAYIESGWEQNDWPYYANYLHILPYWHYAE